MSKKQNKPDKPTQEQFENFLKSLPSVRRPSPPSNDNLSVTTTNNSSATPPGVMRIYRQASSEEGKKMKGAGGLVPGTGNSNKVKWVSESARYASQHHNTNSVQNQNVYRIEVDRQKYEEFRRKCVEKTSLHSKNAKHGSKKGETVSQPPNVWDQQRKRYVGPKRVNQPPPKGKINVGIQHGNIPDFNKLSINGKVKKLSQTAKDNASNWTGI